MTDKRIEEIKDVMKLFSHIAKLVGLIKEAREALELGIGFCVDFRQNKDWEDHPEVGVLFAKFTTILAKLKEVEG